MQVLNRKFCKAWGGLGAVMALIWSVESMAMSIGIEVNGQSFVQELPDNDGARQFAQALPVTVTFENYGSTERIAYLPQKLPSSSNVSCNPKRRDLTYYVPWGNLAVFTKDFRHSSGLLYIGTLSEEVLQAIENSGDSEVTFKQLP